jgi:hypothetical protein
MLRPRCNHAWTTVEKQRECERVAGSVFAIVQNIAKEPWARVLVTASAMVDVAWIYSSRRTGICFSDSGFGARVLMHHRATRNWKLDHSCSGVNSASHSVPCTGHCIVMFCLVLSCVEVFFAFEMAGVA